MAIGPQSDRTASGRLVVIATVYGLMGAIAALLGIGPQVRPTTEEVRLAGVIAIGLGATMLLAGAALALRVRGARALGTSGALATAALGAMVGFLSLADLDECASGGRNPGECHVLIGAIGLAGVAVVAFGLGSMIVILRTPRRRYRRQRR